MNFKRHWNETEKDGPFPPNHYLEPEKLICHRGNGYGVRNPKGDFAFNDEDAWGVQQCKIWEN